MPYTVVLLPDNNLTFAPAFANVFREKFTARSLLALKWYSILPRLNDLPVRILLEKAPHPKLLASDEI